MSSAIETPSLAGRLAEPAHPLRRIEPALQQERDRFGSTGPAEDHVVAEATRKNIVAGKPVQDVSAVLAEQGVLDSAAGQAVVAAAKNDRALICGVRNKFIGAWAPQRGSASLISSSYKLVRQQSRLNDRL